MYEKLKLGIRLNDTCAIPTVKPIGSSVMFCILVDGGSIVDYIQSKGIMKKE